MSASALQWSLVTPFGIVIDEEKDAWHTGHINDMVQLDGGEAGMLVASQTGGVWIVNRNNDALPLSDRWNKPDVNCLAAGPDGPRHFFAGVSGSGDGGGYPDGIGAGFVSAIYEADPESSLPLLNWKEIAGFPADAGNVNDIAVIRRHRRIVAACDNGLYWAEIPPPNPAPGCLSLFFPTPTKPVRDAFVWHKVADPGLGQEGYVTVEIGSLTGRTELAGEEDLSGVSVIVGSRSAGAFLGRWSVADLTIAQARLLDDKGAEWTAWWWLPGSTGGTSVAVCERFPTNAYLVTAYKDGQLKTVARSKNGGKTWVMSSKLLRTPAGDADLTIAAGDQGNYWNNCITVAPNAPGVVAVGWQNGTFVTPDGGGTWKQIADSPHLHSDVHTLRITLTDDGIHDLWIGSDGGLARVNLDVFLATGNVEAQSNYNRQLPIIQCYSTYVLRQFWGTLSASATAATNGFVAVGVQDNCNLYTDLSAGPVPWHRLDGGDGGWVSFLEGGGLLHRNKDNPVGVATRELPGPLMKHRGIVPLEPAVPGAPVGLGAATFGDAVRHPSFRGPTGQHMVAVGAMGSNIYGMYMDPASSTGYRWEFLATLPFGLMSSCVASYSGHTVFAASGARIFAVDSKSGFVLELPVKLPKLSPAIAQTGGGIGNIVAVDSKTAFAVISGTSAGNNYILRLDGLVWRVPGVVTPINSPFFGFDAGRNQEGTIYLFAASGTRVWASDDESRSWSDVSGVLPERPHNAELRLVTSARQSWLYLSTFGRSVWRAPINGFA